MIKRFLDCRCTKSILMNSIFVYTRWKKENNEIEYEMIRMDISENCILDYERGMEDERGIDRYALQYVSLACDLVYLSEQEYFTLIYMAFEYNERIYDTICFLNAFMKKHNIKNKSFDTDLKLRFKRVISLYNNLSKTTCNVLKKVYGDKIRVFKACDEYTYDEIEALINSVYGSFIDKKRAFEYKSKMDHEELVYFVEGKEYIFSDYVTDKVYEKISTDRKHMFLHDEGYKRFSDAKDDLYLKLCEDFQTEESFLHYFMMKIVNRDTQFIRLFSFDGICIPKLIQEKNYKRIAMEYIIYYLCSLEGREDEAVINVLINTLKNYDFKHFRTYYLEEDYSMITNNICNTEILTTVFDFTQHSLEKHNPEKYNLDKCKNDKEIRNVCLYSIINNGKKSQEIDLTFVYEKGNSNIINNRKVLGIDYYEIDTCEINDFVEDVLGREFPVYEYEIDENMDFIVVQNSIKKAFEDNFKGIYKKVKKLDDIKYEKENIKSIVQKNIYDNYDGALNGEGLFLMLKYRKDNRHVNQTKFHIDDDREFVLFAEDNRVLLVILSYLEEESIDWIRELEIEGVKKIDEFEIDEFDIESIKTSGLKKFLE